SRLHGQITARLRVMQPKITATVACTDRQVGEVTRLIIDPLTQQISHVAIDAGGVDILAPAELIASVSEHEVRLRCTSAELGRFERLRRDDFVSIEEVEIPHLERRLHGVRPGEVLVPVPALEKDVTRRSFFTKFTAAIGAVLALPLAFPALRYIIDPMYLPFDNSWLKFGRIDALREPGVPQLLKFHKTVKEGFLTREFEKSHWAMRVSPELREKIYAEGDIEFRDANGEVVWTNSKEAEVVVFSGKCPHLGCAYRWRKHRTFGQTFICPCHLSIFDPAGKVLDGPSPRPLDVLPVKVAGNEIQIIDMEFKAGKAEQVRIV
ncbi:MAG: ubiquinol-cytochrome c reductase iron-sulfur subunit, partial [Nitrospirota bacterium]